LDLANWQQHTQMVEYVLNHRCETEARPPKLVDGHDLIRLFGMSPGPKMGGILEAVREGQASGELTTREKALAFVDKIRENIPLKTTDFDE
ncbi:MAG: hypothetical protein HY528_01785, partial [Chloroflexi bacterium]|nr:hypothetical protein [Chloroflexota bacterium]